MTHDNIIICLDALLNKYFIALNKPAGMLSIPDRKQSEPSLKDMMVEKYGEIFTVHRLDKGTSGVIDFAKDHGFSLVIALDCGIKANDKIDYANEKHIDFIICDHHLPGDQIPKAIAVVLTVQSFFLFRTFGILFPAIIQRNL